VRADAERHFVIGYVGIAEEPAAKHDAPAQRWRYEAAVFRLDNSDSALLWVADETIGHRSQRTEGVHGGIHRDLWTANQEAIDWVRLAGELGMVRALRAYATFSEFDHAVGGLVGTTLGAVPRDIIDDHRVASAEQSFDLWNPAPQR
jgi:hypothetical protein